MGWRFHECSSSQVKECDQRMTNDEEYEFESIIDCEVRYFKPSRTDDVGTLELWWRIKWSTGTSTGCSTLEPESVFDEFGDSKYIEDYIDRHQKSIYTKATKALEKYPNIKTISSQYYTSDSKYVAAAHGPGGQQHQTNPHETSCNEMIEDY